MSINVCTFSGYLGRDTEMVQVGEKQTDKASNSIAVSNYRPAGENATMWINLEAWGSTAKLLGYGQKGQLVSVTGRLDEDVWQQDGQEKRRLKLVVSDVQLPPKAESANQTHTTQSQQPAMIF